MEEYSSGSCNMNSEIVKTEPEEIYIKEENYIPEFDENIHLQDVLSNTNDKSESNDCNTKNEAQFRIIIDDNNKKLYECGICKRLLHERSFKKHYTLHSGEFPYQCMMCRWKALNRDTIATHMLSKHQILVDPEEIPKIVPKIDQNDPRYTIILGQGNRKLYECAVCKRRLARKKGFQNHYMTHTGDYPYACTVCDHKSREIPLVVRHMFMQHRMVVRPSDIMKCDNGNRKDNQVTEPNQFGKRVCKVLSYGNRKFYKCTICNTRLHTKKRFNEHLRIHSYLKNKSQPVINESQYKKTQVLCKICGQDIPKHIFKKHMFNHSKASKTYYCAICRWKSKTKNVLYHHFQKEHQKILSINGRKTDIKEVQHYICKFCNVPFSHWALFKQHMCIHSCIKKRKRSNCNNPTAQEDELKEHVELKHVNQVHENESTSIQPKLEILFVDTEIKDHIKNEPVEEKPEKDKRTRFICKFCPFTSSTRTPYRTHLKIHRINGNNAKRCYKVAPKGDEKESIHYTVVMDGEVKAYKCTICGKTMKERYLIRKHVWVHTGQFPMTCVLCKAKIRLKESMKFHLKREHNLDVLLRDIENDGSLKVDIKDSNNVEGCYTVAPKKEEEKESVHYTVVIDGEVKTYKCTICGKTTKERYLIRRHVWVHTGQFPMTCVLCKAKFRLKKSMKFHLKKEHNVDVHVRDIQNDGRLKVDIKHGNNAKGCDTVALKEEEKESVHYTVVMDGEVKAYKCTICGETRTERYLMRRHVWVHTGQFPMTCVLCKTKIRLKNSMKRHLKKEHNLDVRLRDIENDGKLKVDIREYQKKSVENNHPKVKLEKLDTSAVTAECLNPFEVKSESNDPISTAHRKELPTHTGKLPYSCEICGHKGGTKKIVKNHMRRVHKVNISTLDIPDMESETESGREDDITNSIVESKKFPCVLCGKSFNTQYQFNKHKLSHSDDRPYFCPHCTYKSKSKYLLKTHLFRTHKIRFSVTNIPPRKTSAESEVIMKEEFQVTDANTIQTETSPKMLQCESCHFTCSGSLTLTRHRKRAHNTYDKSDINDCTLDSPEFVTVKEELPDSCNDVSF